MHIRLRSQNWIVVVQLELWEIAQFGEELKNQKSDYDYLIIGLNTERQVLYERINHRVELMMAAGLLDEAKMLYEHFREAQVARAIGYKEFFPYFDGQNHVTDCGWGC